MWYVYILRSLKDKRTVDTRTISDVLQSIAVQQQLMQKAIRIYLLKYLTERQRNKVNVIGKVGRGEEL